MTTTTAVGEEEEIEGERVCHFENSSTSPGKRGGNVFSLYRCSSSQ